MDQIFSNKSFKSLGLNQWLISNCKKIGFMKPTYVQVKCICPILQGKDVLVRAETGSGKTAAFVLPILNQLAKDPFGIYAIIITTSHELAFQIEEQFTVLGLGLNLKTTVIVGGTNLINNSKDLEKRPHIVISTPGRLAHLIKDKIRIPAQYLKFLVLDEADRLFEKKIWKDVNLIIQTLPKKYRQSLLFSATLESSMEKLTKLNLNSNAEFIKISSSSFGIVSTIRQEYLLIPQILKLSYLVSFLRNKRWKDKYIIVFVSTCEYCQYVSETLRVLKISSSALHSQINQNRRLAAIGKFKSGMVKILITTDIGSRGLDIPQIELVLNYDVPRIAEDYIHRCGRTGRVNSTGFAITFVTQYDIKLYLKIEALLGKKLPLINFPDGEKIALNILKEVNKAYHQARVNCEFFKNKNLL